MPAKIYEYLRSGKPILGLTDPEGDTADVLGGAGLNDIARLDSADEIARVLLLFIAAVQNGYAASPDPTIVKSASRRGRSESLVRLLCNVAE